MRALPFMSSFRLGWMMTTSWVSSVLPTSRKPATSDRSIGWVRKGGALRDGRIGSSQIGVIEQIESFQTSLKIQSIDQRDTLEHRCIDVFDTRSTKNVPRGIAVVPHGGLNER